MWLLRNCRNLAGHSVDVLILGPRVAQVAPRIAPSRDLRVVDAGGRLLLNGLRDAHVHFAQWASARGALLLTQVPTAVGVADRVAAAARESSGRITGAGFRDAGWPDQPTVQMLDRAAPGRSVVLHSLDVHSVWMSSTARQEAEVPTTAPAVLREHDAWEAVARLDPLTNAETDRAVDAAICAAHARGVTRITDFDFDRPLDAWQRQAQRRPALGLHVTAVVQTAELEQRHSEGLRTGAQVGPVAVGPVKVFMDGALGSRTARCTACYNDGTFGRVLTDEPALRALAHRAARSGFSMAIHVIGDAALDTVLDAVDSLPAGSQLEHVQFLRGAQIPAVVDAGLLLSMQPAHLFDDAAIVDQHWPGGTPIEAYALRSLHEAGAKLAFGSDAPVSALDPWKSIAAAVHRTDGSAPPWRVREKIDLHTALASSGTGDVNPGPADLTLLDVDSLDQLSGPDLAAVPVTATMFSGTWVHGPWTHPS